MDHLLTCTCGKEHVVNASQAGQEIPCTCGASVSVPTLRELSALPKATREDNTPPKRKKSEIWRSWRGPAVAVATGICFIALVFSGRFLLQWSAMDTSHTTEQELSAGDQIFDEYSPEELSLVWNSYAEVGIGDKILPMYERIIRYAEDRMQRAIISGSIAILFGLIALSIIYSARLAANKPTGDPTTT